MKKIIITYIAILFTILLKAQAPLSSNNSIHGFVKSNGENLPYVSVIIKGTTIGAATNEQGKYTIPDLPDGEYTIIIKAVGYKSKEQTIKLKSNSKFELNFELVEDNIGIEQVIVSAGRNDINKKEATIMVNTIGIKTLEMTQSSSLAEGLDFASGLRMECNCQNCGFSQVRMNGLEGPYSQILINSRPVFSGLAGVYGLELFPPNMIAQVEVVRGGGSALYGGNAIAGTINIITKEPTNNSFSLSGTYSGIGIGHESSKSIAFDKLMSFNGSIVSDNRKSGISLYAMLRNSDPYDDNGDGFSEEVLLENQTVGFSTYYKPTQRTKLSLDFYNIKEFRRGGNKFEYLAHESDITEQLRHNITGASLSFDLYNKNYDNLSVYTSMQAVDRDSYYGAMQDESAYGNTTDMTSSNGLQFTKNFKSDAKFIVGIDHTYNKLTDTKLGVAGNSNTTISNQKVNTYGSFAQYEVKFNWFKLTTGLRYDNYIINDISHEEDDISGKVLVPRANILIDITDYLQFRTSYAMGYRSPQLFDEDLHIETSGARRVTHSNSPDLKQETSNSVNTSFSYSNVIGNNNPVQTEFTVEGFYTKLQDPFTNEFSPIDENGNIEFIRTNAKDGAMVYGANFEANIAFSKDFVIQTGFTYQRSLFEKAQQWGELEDNLSKEFMRSPDTYGFFTLNLSPIKNLTSSITGTYTGTMLVPHFGLDANTTDPNEIAAIENGDVITGEKLVVSDDFYNIGIKFSYDLKLTKSYNLQISAGMKNILDQSQKDHDSGVYRDAGYIYGPHKSRTVFFGIKISNNM